MQARVADLRIGAGGDEQPSALASAPLGLIRTPGPAYLERFIPREGAPHGVVHERDLALASSGVPGAGTLPPRRRPGIRAVSVAVAETRLLGKQRSELEDRAGAGALVQRDGPKCRRVGQWP